jgi:hypothetical protein
MSNCHRWSKFWWQDWQSDAALRLCSLGAQGYWMRLLCIAHEAETVGHVLINGRQPTARQLGVLTGATPKEQKQFEAELEDNGVFSRTDDGTIYSRRMVKDAADAQLGRESAEKRWGPKSTPPPKGNGALYPNAPPNGVPNGKPSSKPTGDPNSDPNAKSQTQSQRSEGKKVSALNNLLLYPVLAREERTAAQIWADREAAELELRAAGPVGGLAVAIGSGLHHIAWAPGWSPKRTVEEQRQAVAPKPSVQPAHLSDEQLAVARARARVRAVG